MRKKFKTFFSSSDFLAFWRNIDGFEIEIERLCVLCCLGHFVT